MDSVMDDPMSEDEDLDPPDHMTSIEDDDGLVGGAEEADDVYAYADPNDPVDRILDVYLSDHLEDHL